MRGGRPRGADGRRLQPACTHQVIVSARLPQVAVADVHLVVDSGGRNKSSGVRRLDDDDRVAELARMLAGLGESDSGRAHARELLDAAQSDRAE
jgi:DNA repair protein RecN (Recombination protein N)